MRPIAVFFLSVAALFAQGPAAQDPAADLVKQGQQKMREGKRDEGLTLYRQALQASPNSHAALMATGIALDVAGKHAEARTFLKKAVEAARTPEEKARAGRKMGVSYAFENNCAGAAEHVKPVYETYLAAPDFFMAGEIANELARVCIESGSLAEARKWYRMGYEAGLRQPDIKQDRRDLWEFRMEHALARLAARGGDKAEAEKHVAQAKAVLDKGTNPTQAPFYPYLTGYVAFHTGDYQTALADLQKANQNDAFIQVLIAQTHEKLGDRAGAMELYRKIAALNGHNPPAAYAIPFAKRKLE